VKGGRAMSELREIIKNLGLTSEQCSPDRLKEVIKQWAKGCVPKKDICPDNMLLEHDRIRKYAFNDCREEILKKIEEE
jgi:hypothetical protein